MLRLKSVFAEYPRIGFKPKSIILLNALLFALCAMPAANASGATVTLGWDSNSEPDLEGYVIYRNTNSPGPPYNYSDELPEDELADPLHPQVTLTGLQKGKEYYIALTAYNTEGVESSFSNDLCIEVVDGRTELCGTTSSTVSSTSSSTTSTSAGGGGDDGGGGSSGGCFISSVEHESLAFLHLLDRPITKSEVWAILFLHLVLIAAVKLGFNKKRKAIS